MTDAQYLYEKGYRKAFDVAAEIFAEIEKAISELDNSAREAKAKAKDKDYRGNFTSFCNGRISLCDEVYYLLSGLKKKYTESEGE